MSNENIFLYLIKNESSNYTPIQLNVLEKLNRELGVFHEMTEKQNISIYRIGRFINRISEKGDGALRYSHKLNRIIDNISFKTPDVPQNEIFLNGLRVARESISLNGLGLMLKKIDSFGKTG